MKLLGLRTVMVWVPVTLIVTSSSKPGSSGFESQLGAKSQKPVPSAQLTVAVDALDGLKIRASVDNTVISGCFSD